MLAFAWFVADVPAASAQNVFVYPAQGQSQEQQNQDHGSCHVWAVQNSGFDPANPQVAGGAPPPQQEAQQGGVGRGAVRGGLLGLGVGAIAGDAGKGAAIGAVGGGLVGGMRRNNQRSRQAQEQQNYQQQQQAALNQGSSNYHRAFAVCMEGRGHARPGEVVKVLVHVTLKRDVLDPQGKAIQRACEALGHEAVRDVRQGKLFEVELDAVDAASARALVEELCQKLLANPVIEDYRVVGVEP